MSPGFYERMMTGEVLSRLTTDTTLVLSVIGSSVSMALRNILTLVGGLRAAVLHEPQADRRWCSIGVPLVLVPILALGRRLRALSRESQDRIAEVERAGVRDAARGADGAGLHPRGRRAGRASAGWPSAASTRRGGGSARGR